MIARRSWLVAAFVGALPILVHAARTVPRFDGLYGQDPYAYFAYAVGPLLDSLRAGAPLPPFHWPPGYPLAVAVAALAVGATPLAGQLVSVLAGALVPVFTFLLARDLGAGGESGPASRFAVPLLAGLIAGFCPQLGQSSVVVMSDTTSLAAATLGVWCCVRYVGRTNGTERAPRPGWLLLGSAALAYSMLSRWASAIIVLAALLYLAIELAPRLRTMSGRLLLHGSAALVVALLVLSPVLGPLVASLQGRGVATDHTVDFDVVITTWDPANALRSTFENSDGRQVHEQTNLAFYLLAPARHALLTPLFALALPIGLLRVLRERERARLLLLVLWPAAVFGMVVGISWQNFRYTLMMLPPFAILAALGIATAWCAVPRRGRPAIAAGVVGGLVWMAVANDRLTSRFVERKNATLELVQWTLARVPDEAPLVTFGATMAFRRYGRADVEEIYSLDDRRVDELVARREPFFVLLERDRVESQWAELSPGRNFRRLGGGAGLEVVDRHDGYTLFRSGRAAAAPADPPGPAP